MNDNLFFNWFGQDSLLFASKDMIIYIDPYNLPGRQLPNANIVLITHPHFDHLSLENISKIATKDTLFLGPPDVIAKLKENGWKNTQKLKPWKTLTINDLKIETLPAYNTIKHKYHPKNNQWIGYIVTIDEKRIYIAGDTERIPEMKDVYADIAFMPLGQTYTMNSVQEAIEATLDTRASLAIPFHYGMFEGTEQNAYEFKRKLEQFNVEVMIKKIEK